MTVNPRRIVGTIRRYLDYVAKPHWLAVCFLLCALPAGLGSALLSPLGAPPDDLAHIVRAEGLRLGQITNPPSPIANPGEMINSGIFSVIVDMQLEPYVITGNVPASALARTEAIRWGGQNLFCDTQMTLYFPIFYVPAALGLEVGKVLGLGPLYAIYLARVVMLLCFIAMGVVALRLAHFGAVLLFAVLTLPATICLAASCSQDGLIGACALAASLLTRVQSCRRACWPNLAWWGALALLTAIALAKFSYVPLMLFCLAPLRAPGLWKRAGLVLLAALAPAIWLLHIHHTGFFPWPRAPYHPGPLWPGDRSIWLRDTLPAYNIQVLRAHPAEIPLLPLHSVAAQWAGSWRTIMASISRDTVLIQPWEYPCLAAALGLAAFASLPADAPRWRGVDAGGALLILFGCITGVELSLYLTTTMAGAIVVDGVQGRYYLLLLPFCIFPLFWLVSGVLLRLPSLRSAAGLFCLPALVLAAVNAWVLPAFMFHFFRMAGP